MDWYYAESGRQIGPVNELAFNNLVNAGTIKADTLVWRPGMTGWQSWGSMGGVAGASTGVAFCSECGRQFSTDDLAVFGNTYVCAACKPVFTQKLREGLAIGQTLPYAGFWIRFLAIVVDWLILGVLSSFYSGPLILILGFDPRDIAKILLIEAIVGGLSFIVGLAYETFFVGRYGATPGKMICHLKVVRPDGSRITYARSLARHLAKILDSFTLLIGYIIAAFDDEKRSLHDRICDTRVIKA